MISEVTISTNDCIGKYHIRVKDPVKCSIRTDLLGKVCNVYNIRVDELRKRTRVPTSIAEAKERLKAQQYNKTQENKNKEFHEYDFTELAKEIGIGKTLEKVDMYKSMLVTHKTSYLIDCKLLDTYTIYLINKWGNQGTSEQKVIF